MPTMAMGGGESHFGAMIAPDYKTVKGGILASYIYIQI